MFDHFQIAVHYRTGQVEHGHQPRFDQDAVRWAPRPGAPLSAACQYTELRIARLTGPVGGTGAVAGKVIKVHFADDTTVMGPSLPITAARGAWIREQSEGSEVLCFVPESSAKRFEFMSPGTTGIGPLPAPPNVVQAPKPRTQSRWNARPRSNSWAASIDKPAPRPNSSGTPINLDPFEAPTVGELDAFDPSQINPGQFDPNKKS